MNFTEHDQTVYGPPCASNPFDSVGIYHNNLIEYAFQAYITASDTSSNHILDTLENHLKLGFREYPTTMANPVLISNRDTIISKAYWDVHNNQTRDWSNYLATLDDNTFSERELSYIHRIGNLFSSSIQNGQTIKDSLSQIESDVINESWPVGDTTEIRARVAISIAKHSFYYWYDVSQNYPNFSGRQSGISKATTDWWVWTLELAAADVVGGVLVGRYIPDPWAIATGAAVNTGIHAGVMFWEEIKSWFKRIF